MSPEARRAATVAGAATLTLAGAVVLRSHDLELLLHLYAVAMGVAAFYWLVAATAGRPRTLTPPGLRLPRRRPRPERVRELERLEHATEFALSTAFDVHYRLRPHLRQVAQDRLLARGIDLDSDPAAAAALGPEAWELVRPRRQGPEDRAAPGTNLAVLRRAVRALEEL